MTADTLIMDTTVLELIDAQALAAPEAVAVSGPDAKLTYGELSLRADRLARQLLELGVKPGDLVGECVERSTSLVVAVLGIVKAGAAYVASDPSYPDERLRWMLDDAATAAVVADAAAAPRLAGSSDRPLVVLSAGGALERAPAVEAPALAAGELDGAPRADRPLPAAAGAGDLAYVVYTSGSTGRPKGVAIEHASLLNLVSWHRAAFALSRSDRCTQIASPGFDAAVWEIWPALAAGATILVVPDALRNDPAGLRDWLLGEGVTVSFLPTALAELVIGLSWPTDASLRFLLTGGDALTRRPRPGLPFALVNNYGLSETAVVATSGTVTSEGDGPPSIGRAIDGVELHVLDEQLAPVARGAAGELVVGGAAVARGYLNQPELTAERFVDDAQGRLYRTGDRVRVAGSGEIEFLGRLDDQLSIRGFRVEPGEVTAALSAHPAVAASAAVAVGGSSAERQLVAYLVGTGGERPDRLELAAFLAARLPDYMVPSRFVWLERLPLTSHGKLDRDALADAAVAETTEPVGAPAESDVQTAIAAVVAELLDVPDVGVDQNFFVLGGHSMLGAQLIVRLEERFGAVISLRYLFDHPTPAELAVEVERQLAAADRPERSDGLAAGLASGR